MALASKLKRSAIVLASREGTMQRSTCPPGARVFTGRCARAASSSRSWAEAAAHSFARRSEATSADPPSAAAALTLTPTWVGSSQSSSTNSGACAENRAARAMRTMGARECARAAMSTASRPPSTTGAACSPCVRYIDSQCKLGSMSRARSWTTWWSYD